MSTKQFLLGLRRFVAQYGAPKRIISDNAKYFKLANDTLKMVWHDVINSSEAKEFSSAHQIEWQFIPEYSPWMGGFYERLVQNVKDCLKKVLGQKCVTFTEMQTVIAEVTTVVNSRPLVIQSGLDDQAITPAHLLGKRPDRGFLASQGNPKSDAHATSQYEPIVKNTRANMIKVWNENESRMRVFWDIWRKHYLTSLRERAKVAFNDKHTTDCEPAIDDVVIIKCDLPRNRWKLGVITKVFRSKDGCCRSAAVRLPNRNVVIRPIRLLFPIETSYEHRSTETDKSPENLSEKDTTENDISTEPNPTTNDVDKLDTDGIVRRPQRAAAKAATKAIQNQLNNSDSESDEY
jgi:hypothetical protein